MQILTKPAKIKENGTKPKHRQLWDYCVLYSMKIHDNPIHVYETTKLKINLKLHILEDKKEKKDLIC